MCVYVSFVFLITDAAIVLPCEGCGSSWFVEYADRLFWIGGNFLEKFTGREIYVYFKVNFLFIFEGFDVQIIWNEKVRKSTFTLHFFRARNTSTRGN